MKRIGLLCVFLLVSCLAFAQGFEKFIGHWVIEGQPFLNIKTQGDFIALEFPENPAWRSEFKNVRVEEEKLKYEQMNYLKNGIAHPYNGVVNYCEFWEAEDGKMYFRLWTDNMKDQPPMEVTKAP